MTDKEIADLRVAAMELAIKVDYDITLEKRIDMAKIIENYLLRFNDDQ
jgi:hypothetical protein